MEQILTIVCKLQPTEEQCQHLADTLQAFADACQYLHDTVDPALTNRARMQTIGYRDTRVRFGLSANLAIRAIARVAANRKTARQRGVAVKAFRPTSIDYDTRIFSFRECDWTISLTLLRGRERFKLSLGKYQRSKLIGAHPTSAQLCTYCDGQYYLHMQVKIPVATPAPSTCAIGVDLGRTDIAVTSTGTSWSGDEIQRVRERHARLRAQLQHKASKGTRSTRRRCHELLQRLSGREQRFQRHTNHVISKAIVAEAHATHAMLVLEDLTGIRVRTNRQRRGKTERRRSNNWAFYQLRQFLHYKAALYTVAVLLYPPAYTSQMCHRCLHIGRRSGKRFACQHSRCAWIGDADWNAAKNLEILGLNIVSQPRGPWLHCQLQGSSKPKPFRLG